MNTILSICLVIVSIAIVTGTVFWIITLIQLKKVAIEVELVLKTINVELKSFEPFTKIVGVITSAKAIRYLTSFIGGIVKIGPFRKTPPRA